MILYTHKLYSILFRFKYETTKEILFNDKIRAKNMIKTKDNKNYYVRTRKGVLDTIRSA